MRSFNLLLGYARSKVHIHHQRNMFFCGKMVSPPSNGEEMLKCSTCDELSYTLIRLRATEIK
jgi:hypothetical protein